VSNINRPFALPITFPIKISFIHFLNTPSHVSTNSINICTTVCATDCYNWLVSLKIKIY
jgi:hypothetical protein